MIRLYDKDSHVSINPVLVAFIEQRHSDNASDKLPGVIITFSGGVTLELVSADYTVDLISRYIENAWSF